MNLSLTQNQIAAYLLEPTSWRLSLLKQQTFQTLLLHAPGFPIWAAGMLDDGRQCCAVPWTHNQASISHKNDEMGKIKIIML